MEPNKIPVKLNKAIKYIKTFDKIANKFNLTKSEICLNFVNTLADQSIIIFGSETLTQAKQNIETFKKLQKLDVDIIKVINHNFKNIDENLYNPNKW